MSDASLTIKGNCAHEGNQTLAIWVKYYWTHRRYMMLGRKHTWNDWKCGPLLQVLPWLLFSLETALFGIWNVPFGWEFGVYLQQSSSQIQHHKGEGQRRVASLQQMDGVEEHEVPWDNQEEQDSGWLGIHLCRGQRQKEQWQRLQMVRGGQDTAAYFKA